ncbi:hypothetical protein N7457_006591 [Penicillium paradoxum]|uniref:uncharacterized protein n=1 Tax=Penicillium paradoxum TaxID=176176 RepID=UPI0025479BF0|nr:uncharacterized protein N7457_006591 [Penicillium paradoxum]KAJ5778871.1 hypothetical protein N7457_006591 [Penicillium paradoxum]
MAASRITPNRPSIRLSPVHSRNNSRSTSPERIPGSIFQQLDPLLGNLSPESTLRALTSTDVVPSNEQGAHDILSQSISQVSPTERALGIRAAVAAQNLGLWHKEVLSWQWPNQSDAKVGKGFIPLPEAQYAINPSPRLLCLTSNPVESYYGSLPASVVERYESRIDEIRDGMDDLNVEELKEHVLNAHIPSRSRPSSATSCVSVPPPLSYVQLSDFTAVVTATILRALPYLSRLNTLLSTWDVRIFVLRQIPGLLRELTLTRSALDSSLHALRTPHSFATYENRYSDSSLSTDHVKLESAVVAVGRRMDRVLDALEGRLDSLPEEWIDDLEAIESDFAAWVVEAEKYKVQTEWIRSKAEAQIAEMRAAEQLQRAKSLEKAHQDLTRDAGISEPAGHEPQLFLEHAVQHEAEREEDKKLPSCDTNATNPQSVEQPTVSSEGSAEKNGSPKLSVSTSLSKSPIEETREDLTPVVTTEDLETPTQSDFPPAPAISRQIFPTPAHTTCVPLPDLENKENIPPPGLQSLDGAGSPPIHGSAKPTPTPFSEHPALAAGSCIQSSTEVESDARLPEVPISIDLPVTAEPHVSVDRNSPVETMGDDMGNISNGVEQRVVPHPQPSEVTPKSTNSAPGQDTKSQSMVSQRNGNGTPVAAGISPVLTPKSESRLPKLRQFVRASQIPMAIGSPKSCSSSTPIKDQPSTEGQAEVSQRTVRKPLQSPIKLSKSRLGKLDLNKDVKAAPTVIRRRRTSTGSVGSLLSDHSSLMSSPEVPEPRTASSNVTSLSTSPLPEPKHHHSHGDYILREDHLRRLDSQKPDPRISFQQSHTVSLPLERFINERLELGLGGEPVSVVAGVKSSMTRSVTPTEFPQAPKSRSKPTPQTSPAPIARVQHLTTRHPHLSRGKSASDLHSQSERAKITQPSGKTFGTNSARRAMEHLSQPKSLRLRQRLTAHPSLESLGMKRQELSYVEEHESELKDYDFRAASPIKHSRQQPRDHLDEKINSILDSLPGHIHMVDPNQEADTSSSSSSVDRRTRRHSHAYKTEDSCVKLYHLHHGGQAAPTKLFVRTVGEEGQRVMVRVGGGWADLGEYLREYVIHHGRRKVSETPRVEVEGIKTRTSPSYSSPGTMLTPSTSSYLASGRGTPSRPASVLSSRPPSSLTVHKKRRGSTASDVMGTRALTTGHLSSFASPPPFLSHIHSSTGRRLSMSSAYSVGDNYSPANIAAALASNDLRSAPLGLAGPKPRSRLESMSPEGEAWVEDVLQKTRRSSSQPLPPQFALSLPPDHDADDQSEIGDGSVAGHSLPKVRSIGDISSSGTSRRVVLRGLGNRRS